MLLRIDPATGAAVRRPGKRLRAFGVDERRFQAILFENLEELLPEDELLLIMQSARGAEEPDLMAIDATGRLWVFEMKAGEGDHGNLLQVLRYGQIYGQWAYEGYSQDTPETANSARLTPFAANCELRGVGCGGAEVASAVWGSW